MHRKHPASEPEACLAIDYFAFCGAGFRSDKIYALARPTEPSWARIARAMFDMHSGSCLSVAISAAV